MEQLLEKVPLLLLVFSRLSGVTATSPIFSGRYMPLQFRALFTMALAVIVLPSARALPEALTGTGLLAGAVLELLVGMLIGFLSALTFAAVQMAGALVDTDMGFTMSHLFDPVSGQSQPITGAFFQMLTLVVYFAANAHHWLLRGLAGSYDAVPAGGLLATVDGPMHAVLLFGAMLAAAVKMVLPFVGVMLLTSAALAAMNRAVPHMHIFAVGMGAKAVIGLALLMLLLPYFPPYLESLFALGHNELLRTLELLR